MRFFESAPLKLLLTPLVPAAAVGIIALATTFSPAPAQQPPTMQCVDSVPSYTQSPPPPAIVKKPTTYVRPLGAPSK